MLLPRIIPCLLLTNEGLVKTENFKNAKYIGDPINTVKIFNEKKADELMIMDIHATTQSYNPNFDLIDKIAREARMPICYTGGIKKVEHAKKIFSYGIEKIGISSIIFEDIDIISKLSNYVGRQSTVIILDIIKNENTYDIYTHNAGKKINVDLLKFLKVIQGMGAGEIVVNSIDRDGSMIGYDFDLIDLIYDNTEIPITVIGGAKDYNDIKKISLKYGPIGIGAGSIFVYKGSRKAVLINYPNEKEKIELCSPA